MKISLVITALSLSAPLLAQKNCPDFSGKYEIVKCTRTFETGHTFYNFPFSHEPENDELTVTQNGCKSIQFQTNVYIPNAIPPHQKNSQTIDLTEGKLTVKKDRIKHDRNQNEWMIIGSIIYHKIHTISRDNDLLTIRDQEWSVGRWGIIPHGHKNDSECVVRAIH